MNPARTLGPDIVGNDYTGWWVYVAGPVIGAAIAVMIIGLVRGLPGKKEREAAQGDAEPLQ
jgi:aquaporin Z